MAQQQQIFVIGSGKTFTSTKPIGTKALMAVWVYHGVDEVWSRLNVQDYDLINNSATFTEEYDLASYTLLNLVVADRFDELDDNPSDLSIVAGFRDEIIVVAGIADDVVTVADNDANITIVAANDADIKTCALNIDDIKVAYESAVSAKVSETNAKTSETNSKTSETNAKASEDIATAQATIATDKANEIQGVTIGTVVTVPNNPDGSIGSADVEYNTTTGEFTFDIPQGIRGLSGLGFRMKGSALVAEINAVDMATVDVGDGWLMKDGGTITSGSIPTTVIRSDLLVFTESGYWVNHGQARGVKGDKGDTGEQGIQGIDGSQGIQGEQGLRGLTGDVGIQGIQGEQGIQGDIGLTGSDGLGWTDGSYDELTGITTFTSTDGLGFETTDIRGEQGIQGIDGIKGDTGEQGIQGNSGVGINILGSDTVENILAKVAVTIGDSWIATNMGLDSDGVMVNVGEVLRATNTETPTHYVNIGEIKGEKGDTGEQGIQGIQGETGSAGTNGTGWTEGYYTTSTGKVTFVSSDNLGFETDDLRGSQGIQGEQGIQGITGETGSQGLRGETGDTGSQGIQGEQGIQGVQGETGSQGAGFHIKGQASVAYINAQLPSSFGSGVGYIMTDAGTITVGNNSFYVEIGNVIVWSTYTMAFGNLGNIDVSGDWNNITNIPENVSNALSRSGGTMTGYVSGITPTSPLHLATKDYVDNNGGKIPLIGEMSCTVGSGGTYSTVADAIKDLTATYYPTVSVSGAKARVIITLLAGYNMTQSIHANGVNLGWLVLRSSSTINFNYSYWTAISSEGHYCGFLASNGGVLPELDTLFQGAASSLIAGRVFACCEKGSSLISNKGLKDSPDTNVVVLGEAKLTGEYSGAKDRCVRCSGGNLSLVDGALSGGKTGLMCDSGGSAMAQGVAISFTTSFGVYCSGSANVDITDGRVRNNSGVGVYGEEASTISAKRLNVYMAGSTGVRVTTGATISLSNCDIQHNGGIGVLAETSATVGATGAVIKYNDGGIQSLSGARVSVESSDCTQNDVFGVQALSGGYISVYGTNCTQTVSTTTDICIYSGSTITANTATGQKNKTVNEISGSGIIYG